MSATLRIGTRGSELALRQTRIVADLLAAATGRAAEPVVIHTSGDADRSRALWELEGVGFFTSELQDALRDRRVDLVVHSLKDLPIEEPAGLAVRAVLERSDPRELLLARPESLDGGGLGLRRGATLGTSSLRRAGQALATQPDLAIRPLRGNVPTRVRRLREGAYDAIVIAAAGVDRLGLDLGGLHARRFEVGEMVPAPGQGALAVEARAADGDLAETVGALHDPAVAEATGCERAVLQGLGGGCRLPLGAFARRSDGGLELRAALASLDEAITSATVRTAHVVAADGGATARAALGALGGGER